MRTHAGPAAASFAVAPPGRRSRSTDASGASASLLLSLQRTAGNQAVVSGLQKQASGRRSPYRPLDSLDHDPVQVRTEAPAALGAMGSVQLQRECPVCPGEDELDLQRQHNLPITFQRWPGDGMTPKSKAPQRPSVKFVAFRTRGQGQCPDNSLVPLGVLPNQLANSVEIEFAVKPASSRSQFRIRRFIEEGIWFEKGESRRRVLYIPRWGDDHPDLPAGCLSAPRLFDYDCPGLQIGLEYVGELSVGSENGPVIKTDPGTEVVEIRMNFVTRVQERPPNWDWGKKKGFVIAWEYVGRAVRWHSILTVRRTKDGWRRYRTNVINRGHIAIKA